MRPYDDGTEKKQKRGSFSRFGWRVVYEDDWRGSCGRPDYET